MRAEPVRSANAVLCLNAKVQPAPHRPDQVWVGLLSLPSKPVTANSSLSGPYNFNSRLGFATCACDRGFSPPFGTCCQTSSKNKPARGAGGPGGGPPSAAAA